VVVVRRDGSEGESFVFRGPSLTIGREMGEIRFAPDAFISPRHARIDRHPHGVELHDLDSRNGVYVRILSAQGVYPGDHFLLGHQLMRLDNLEGEELEAAPDANGVRAFGTPLEPAWGKLVLIGVGGRAADVYYLRGTQTVFGREGGDILFPADAFLSRRHARVRMELRGGAMSVILEDLGSANGTYLRLRGSAVLGSGDMFRVGDQLFRVQGV
jgi:pSer/pThr/pTyr-binding forkhead associated (FHA) protein